MTEQRWEIPSSWAWASMDEVSEIVGGGTPSAKDGSNFADEGIRWLTPADLTGYKETFISRGRRDLSEKGYRSSAARILPAGTVLFSSRAPIGYCAIASGEISTNQGFKSFVLKGKISPEYIRHYLLASVDYAESKASGTTFMELSGGRAAELSTPIAPLSEQRRIVAKIDSLTGKSRRARDHLDHIPRLVEKYKQAILAAAFRGDLTTDWRNSNEQTSGERLRESLLSARIGAERGKKLPAFDFAGAEHLPQLPASWVWMPVNALATKVVDGVHKKPEYITSGVPFLTVKNLTAGPGISFQNCRHISESDHRDFIRRTHPEKGDILITKDGTLGVVRAVRTDVEFSIFVSLALVKPVDRSMADYLELAFQSPAVQDQMGGVGSGLQHIHLTDLRKDFIPMAPENERHEIVRRVDSAMKWINRLAADSVSARKLIDRLDQAVLAKAFKGELVPQDPADEPASSLLERIRAERAAAPKAKRGRKKAA
ncbi:restriction endonuclease subunit S [Sphingobium cupriresistens]|uniref:Specificity determinant for hsdM and hsdR n=1 Tax=Sphingobium cupriresistens TaxID=1132417 RepID=A0A8G2DW22_9SPHN|nr:restriction endonuclease subunit S [Sphingobium cupriresistens]RYM09627.1 specificity determinant for hsdM and hsdR [Sphingobium cupriresistens]